MYNRLLFSEEKTTKRKGIAISKHQAKLCEWLEHCLLYKNLTERFLVCIVNM